MHLTETGHAIRAAIDGHGIALGDACMVAGDLEAGRLARLFDLSVSGPPGFSFRIVTPIETADTDLIRSFREWVLAEANNTMAMVSARSSYSKQRK